MAKSQESKWISCPYLFILSLLGVIDTTAGGKMGHGEVNMGMTLCEVNEDFRKTHGIVDLSIFPVPTNNFHPPVRWIESQDGIFNKIFRVIINTVYYYLISYYSSLFSISFLPNPVPTPNPLGAEIMSPKLETKTVSIWWEYKTHAKCRVLQQIEWLSWRSHSHTLHPYPPNLLVTTHSSRPEHMFYVPILIILIIVIIMTTWTQSKVTFILWITKPAKLYVKNTNK